MSNNMIIPILQCKPPKISQILIIFFNKSHKYVGVCVNVCLSVTSLNL